MAKNLTGGHSKESAEGPAIALIHKGFRHPAFLLMAGNTALAFGQAQLVAFVLNIALTIAVYVARVVELRRDRSFGIPFSILVVVNLLTAASVELRHIHNETVSAHFSVFAYVAWAMGHVFAGRNERLKRTSRRWPENPQFYYGLGDVSAVNAGDKINPFSLPFMIIGLVRSLTIGRAATTLAEVTAARLYGTGYAVGAATSLSTPSFMAAQLLWALAYFHFPRDTQH